MSAIASDTTASTKMAHSGWTVGCRIAAERVKVPRDTVVPESVRGHSAIMRHKVTLHPDAALLATTGCRAAHGRIKHSARRTTRPRHDAIGQNHVLAVRLELLCLGRDERLEQNSVESGSVRGIDRRTSQEIGNAADAIEYRLLIRVK
jgi:hypothetical protein